MFIDQSHYLNSNKYLRFQYFLYFQKLISFNGEFSTRACMNNIMYISDDRYLNLCLNL